MELREFQQLPRFNFCVKPLDRFGLKTLTFFSEDWLLVKLPMMSKVAVPAE